MFPKAAQSFAELSNQSLEYVHLLIQQNEVFKKFETGNLTPLAFRSLIREVFQTPDWTDGSIDAAWNSLLLDIPPDRIKKIQELSQKGLSSVFIEQYQFHSY